MRVYTYIGFSTDLLQPSSPEKVLLVEPHPNSLALEVEGKIEQVDYHVDCGHRHEHGQRAIRSDVVVDHPRPDPRDAALKRGNGHHYLNRTL